MLFKNLFRTIRQIHSSVREIAKEKTRSPRWSKVRDAYLHSHPVCEACGSSEKMQVHHVKPFHLQPELELEVSNLISLCMGENECHLYLGHGDSFSCYNPNVRNDARKFSQSSIEDRQKIVVEAKKNRIN